MEEKVEQSGQYTTSIAQVIEPEELHSFGLTAPHTTHCLPSGQLMISTLGDEKGGNRGAFLLIDAPNSAVPRFRPSALWNKADVPFGYDYWYQPRHDIMVSSEWGAPAAFKTGFSLDHLGSKQYGTSIHLWQWSTGKLLQSIDLSTVVPGTSMPLEVRFLHEPSAAEGYVGCALSGNVFRFFKDSDDKWTTEEVIRIAGKGVSGWSMSTLPALITDILISLDDRFLYVSAWAFGEIRQYDIAASRSAPPLTGIVRIGGIPATNPSVRVLEDPDEDLLSSDQIFSTVKGVRLQAGSQMLQLSLDGRRLYVTNSLHSAWDRQFYPGMLEKGSQLLKVDVDTVNGGMALDEHFLVDFGTEPKGPALAHEMRYPGGDCTSDIWI